MKRSIIAPQSVAAYARARGINASPGVRVRDLPVTLDKLLAALP